MRASTAAMSAAIRARIGSREVVTAKVGQAVRTRPLAG